MVESKNGTPETNKSLPQVRDEREETVQEAEDGSYAGTPKRESIKRDPERLA